MQISGITPESVVDGPGVRFVIFTQGCPHHCPKCHNQHTWCLNGGKIMTVKEISRLIRKEFKKNIRGVTFSGGEPFLQAEELTQIADMVHSLGHDIVTYTGYTYEHLLEKGTDAQKALLNASDILIDGPFVYELKDIQLRFRGSSNQRIIDVRRSREAGQIVLWEG